MKLQSGIGSSFYDFLQEEGLLAEAEAVAIKKVIAFQLKETMAKDYITKTEMVERMSTSRSAINRSRSTQYIDHTCNDRKCSSGNEKTTSNSSCLILRHTNNS